MMGQHFADRVPCKTAQADNDAGVSQQGEFLNKVAEAIIALRRSRLIVRRCTADASGDVAIAQCQPIVLMSRSRLVGKAGAIEGRVKPVAGAIAGKYAPGAVAAMSSGGQPANN